MTNTSEAQRLDDFVASCKYRPTRWFDGAFDWGQGELAKHNGPRNWQMDIAQTIEDHLQSENRHQPLRISVASGHGIGKSACMGMTSSWAMSCFKGAKILTTANTDGQLRTKTAPEIGKWFKLACTRDWFDVQTTSIKAKDPNLAENWRQDFAPWSEHNTEAFAGLHNEGKIIVLLFDEASNIADKVWEVAEGAMTDADTVIIWIAFGNPTRNTGRFRECFRKFRHRWINKQIDSRTVEGTNKKFLQQLVDDNGEDSDVAKVRVRGLFPSASAKQYISASDADNAQRVHLREDQYKFAPVIIGVDPAWTGDDPTVIYLRQGLYSKKLASIPKNDNDGEVAMLIARFEDEYKADAVFIDAGYGTGIHSFGTVMGRNWLLVWFGSTAVLDPGFLNVRAYIWGKMKEWLKAGGAIEPDNVTLHTDLTGVETKPRPDGKVQLEAKEDMKKRGVPSPNDADALALTFTQPVAKKVQTTNVVIDGERREIETAWRGAIASMDYDPLA